MLTLAKQSPDLVYYSTLQDPIAGKLLVGETEEGKLCRVSFLYKTTIKDVLTAWQKEWPKTVFKKTSNPKIKKFTPKMKLLLVGTEFQHNVWLELLSINRGETSTYGSLAKQIKRPKAVRAVGTALGKNPLPIILPCHRVISSDGSLGGFAANLNLKEKLLISEGATN